MKAKHAKQSAREHEASDRQGRDDVVRHLAGDCRWRVPNPIQGQDVRQSDTAPCGIPWVGEWHLPIGDDFGHVPGCVTKRRQRGLHSECERRPLSRRHGPHPTPHRPLGGLQDEIIGVTIQADDVKRERQF